ncbi:amidohydrolase 2 [Grosmannia clavigera kw1407]|uniref:6-methylsalicylate decarboxylase n=1 Tax=Grosmannia clavigera (strain kw1407 / UAMH 11150) TaxID=655863 RepID=F0X9X1_GROCL|nr:amidohydrolase 2 [Grosmannia clavigera kw1407]EFX05342.1 amidohydrolase 2 [Grosmannia clavigera kw1407]
MKSSLANKYCYVLACFSQLVAAAKCSGINKIDVHSHFLPDFYAQALRDAGQTPGPDGMPGIPATQTWTPELSLQFMANNSIDKSYLSISSPGVYLAVPSINATNNAISLARRVNEYAANLTATYPDKFGYFAALPLPDVQASLKEIDYVFSKLSPKPDGVALLSNFFGMYFGDPALDPVYKALNALNVTIFEHPTTPCTQYAASLYNINDTADPVSEKDWAALNRPVATRQFAAPTLDFPFETARTFADLFYSTIPTRFPNLKWIMPHAGGGIIPTIDRIVTYSSLYSGLNLTDSSMKATLARSFYFDLAGPWPVNFAIAPLLRWVDYTNILWGSDTPFTPFAAGSALSTAFNSDVQTAFDGNMTKIHAVQEGNARTLFGP